VLHKETDINAQHLTLYVLLFYLNQNSSYHYLIYNTIENENTLPFLIISLWGNVM